MASVKRFLGTGRRKTSVARVTLTPGSGKFIINREKDLDQYFGRATLRMIVQQPFEVTGNNGKFDVFALVAGGGMSGQAGALTHGIARALLSLNSDLRKPLRKNGFLTRDSRRKERKKYGRHGARRSTQFSKR